MKISTFVPKGNDPLVTPRHSLRRHMWSMVISNTHEGEWEATSEQLFKEEISKSIEALGAQVVKNIISGVPRHVRNAARAVALRHVHYAAT